MSKLSIVVPTYNEEENVIPLFDAIVDIIRKKLNKYDYEIIFIDNCSNDKTRDRIRWLCDTYHEAKAIFNTKNFGQFNSPYHAMLQSSGDCTVLMAADFQDPVEMIPKFVYEWEKGYKIVCGIKTTSNENKIMYFLRSCYYKTIGKMSSVEQIEHFTGFGLYDNSFIGVLRNLDDPTPFLRGVVTELGPQHKKIAYEQPMRRAGRTSNNFYRLYDAAMLSFTSYTKIGLRLATFGGFILSGLSIMTAIVFLFLKLIYWDRYPAGTIPLLLAVLVFGSVQLFFIGLLGEYIMSMNTRIMKRPLVVEEARINF